MVSCKVAKRSHGKRTRKFGTCSYGPQRNGRCPENSKYRKSRYSCYKKGRKSGKKGKRSKGKKGSKKKKCVGGEATATGGAGMLSGIIGGR